jgi:hypothetical protein
MLSMKLSRGFKLGAASGALLTLYEFTLDNSSYTLGDHDEYDFYRQFPDAMEYIMSSLSPDEAAAKIAIGVAFPIVGSLAGGVIGHYCGKLFHTLSDWTFRENNYNK